MPHRNLLILLICAGALGLAGCQANGPEGDRRHGFSARLPAGSSAPRSAPAGACWWERHSGRLRAQRSARRSAGRWTMPTGQWPGGRKVTRRTPPDRGRRRAGPIRTAMRRGRPAGSAWEPGSARGACRPPPRRTTTMPLALPADKRAACGRLSIEWMGPRPGRRGTPAAGHRGPLSRVTWAAGLIYHDRSRPHVPRCGNRYGSLFRSWEYLARAFDSMVKSAQWRVMR